MLDGQIMLSCAHVTLKLSLQDVMKTVVNVYMQGCLVSYKS